MMSRAPKIDGKRRFSQTNSPGSTFVNCGHLGNLRQDGLVITTPLISARQDPLNCYIDRSSPLLPIRSRAYDSFQAGSIGL